MYEEWSYDLRFDLLNFLCSMNSQRTVASYMTAFRMLWGWIYGSHTVQGFDFTVWASSRKVLMRPTFTGFHIPIYYGLYCDVLSLSGLQDSADDFASYARGLSLTPRCHHPQWPLVTPCSGCTRGGVSLRFAAHTFTELAGVVLHLLVCPLDYVVCDYDTDN